MFKRIKGMKDGLWALAIGAALLALLVGFIAAAFTPYNGDRERPVMDLRSGQKARAAEKQAEAEAAEAERALRPNGKLHSLQESKDAGEAYTDSLCYLCDSSFIGLRSAGLSSGQVWGSETGVLSMASAGDWTIRYPGDGSTISPANAAMILKPAILVIAVGSDGLKDLGKEAFIENYEKLINGVADASPQTQIICLSLPSVTAAYVGEEGLDKAHIAEVNEWIRSVCTDTGAWYGNLEATLCVDSWLRSDYADGSGRSLNSTGLRALLEYLRGHALT